MVAAASASERTAALLAPFAEAADELEQVVALLRFAGVEQPKDMTLAEGDRRIFELQRRICGQDLEVNAVCPNCETASAALVSAESLPQALPRMARLGAGGGLREPTYADLIDLPEGQEEAELLRRCTVGTPSRPATDEDLDLVDDSLSGPLLIECSGCGRELEVPLDLERVILERVGLRLAEFDVEVHLLASAYHWTLAAIEAIPDQRRRVLSNLVAEGR